MKPLRSFPFVPGNKESMLDECDAAGAPDVGRALKYAWTPEGRESKHMKSRVVMAALAAGKWPIGGIRQQIKDLEGLAKSSAFDRQLGMAGALAEAIGS